MHICMSVYVLDNIYIHIYQSKSVLECRYWVSIDVNEHSSYILEILLHAMQRWGRSLAFDESSDRQ